MQPPTEDSEEETLSQILEKLARKFSHDTGRAGNPSLEQEEGSSGQTKHQASYSHGSLKVELAASTDAFVPKSEPAENSFVNPTDNPLGRRLLDISELRFEAKSLKDEAWYDVAFFVNHRVHRSGEFEVLARFLGFGKEEDEWVNVKRAVRERSIPVEPSECEKVQVGDLVLCFQEKMDQALYFDAHIVEIRRSHDISGCSCVFLVRFDHDNSEESVGLTSICRRPP